MSKEPPDLPGVPTLPPVVLNPGQGHSIQFGPGEHFLFRATAETTGGQFSLFEVTAQPVPGPPEHTHTGHDETYYVLEGRFSVKIGDRCVTLTPGSFAFIPRGVPHTFQNLEPRRGRFLILATPGGIERYYEELRPYMWTAVTPADLRPVLDRHGVAITGPSLPQP